MTRTKKKFVIAIVDYLLFFLSLCIVILIRYGVNNFKSEMIQHFPVFSLIYFLWIIIFYIFELYDMTHEILIKNYILAMLINGAIAVTIFYTVSGLGITPKTNLLLNLVIFTLLFIPWRSIVSRNFGKIFGRMNVIILGCDEYSLKLANDIISNDKMGYKLLGILKDKNADLSVWLSDKKIKIYNSFDEIKESIQRKNLHVVVVNDYWYKHIFTDLYALIFQHIDIYNLPSFSEELNQSIPIYAVDEIWFLDNLKNVGRSFYEKLKRVTDIFLVLLLLPVFILVFLFVFIAIKLNSPGSVLFKQVRVGRNDKQFVIYKFRTMIQDAEKNGAQWAVKNDTRITSVGRFLRLTRFDELPQIINVLIGDMSFIGPRPERPEFVDELVKTVPHYKLRHLVRPGLSGWAQVKYEYAATKEESAKKLEYDLFYIKNRSIILDLKIVLKTIMTIVSRRGQ